MITLALVISWIRFVNKPVAPLVQSQITEPSDLQPALGYYGLQGAISANRLNELH